MNTNLPDIAFLWHMHQPFYKDSLAGKYLMPWARLHAVKDYYPMAALIERFENVKVSFNLVPVLVEQLNDYVENGVSDRLLDLTAIKASSLVSQDKVQILEHFFKVNFKHFIEPNPRYSELLLKKGVKPLAGAALKRLLATFSDQDFLDLQILFNLSWFHSISIDEDSNLRGIKEKAKGYTEEDKIYIIAKQREIMARVLPLYRRLQDAGRIEITTTPYYHPILPLVCDTSIAYVSSGMPLPKRRFAHPEDAAWHIEAAVKYHTAQFGRLPNGMWPSEGSVSDEALDIMISSGIKWVATDEDILFKSLSLYDKRHKHTGAFDRRLIYRPYKVKRNSKSITMIFRDKNLSDIISFNYNAWDQQEAACDLIDHFRKIGENMRRDTDRALVAIVMDGENAWEYFEDNGRRFFEELYSNLDRCEVANSTTISDHLRLEPPRKTLSNIFPASWINRNFGVWIGDEQDNLSWEYLEKSRSDLVRLTKKLKREGKLDAAKSEAAWRELYIAEGSDWNWWYSGKVGSGANNPFDKLYRTHLMNIYKILGVPIPDFLKISIA